MLARLRHLVAISLLAALLAACATTATDPTVGEPGGAAPEAPGTASDPPTAGSEAILVSGDDGFVVTIDGPAIELRQRDGEQVHEWTLGDGERFHSFLVHPGGSAEGIDVVALALHGERPVLVHVYARADGESGIAEFPEHLQPAHEVDTGPPVVAWTPDGRSLVWTEPAGDTMVLRAIGWEGGPGTGRRADDNATFTLDAPGGGYVDGFEVTAEAAWTLILRGGGSTEPIEIPVERQEDGSLAIPAGP